MFCQRRYFERKTGRRLAGRRARSGAVSNDRRNSTGVLPSNPAELLRRPVILPVASMPSLTRCLVTTLGPKGTELLASQQELPGADLVSTGSLSRPFPEVLRFSGADLVIAGAEDSMEAPVPVVNNRVCGTSICKDMDQAPVWQGCARQNGRSSWLRAALGVRSGGMKRKLWWTPPFGARGSARCWTPSPNPASSVPTESSNSMAPGR